MDQALTVLEQTEIPMPQAMVKDQTHVVNANLDEITLAEVLNALQQVRVARMRQMRNEDDYP